MERERMEAERDAMVEKAEREADRMEARRRKRRRRTRRRAEMDEETTEAAMAEAKRAQLEREAKKAQLELEREMDEQRREAEVVELELLLAEFERDEAEMEATKKRMEEDARIFRVWWEAWEQEDRDVVGEDRPWVKTWALRSRRMFSMSRPLALMALWKAWKPWKPDDEDDENLFIELYDSICGEKMNELLLNNWNRKQEVQALKESGKKVLQQELEDDELYTYCRKYIDFRNCWEDKYCYQHGQFEDITKMRCMDYSRGSVPRLVFRGPRPTTLQIFSVKIGGRNHGGLSWPLQVYGLIAVRDFVDPQRNAIFNRYRDECHIVTEKDAYLPLSGPTRAVVVDINESMGPVTIEAELKVKGSMESEDKYIILDAISLPTLVGSSLFELAGPHMKLEISLGAIQKSVEATIFIRVVDGAWPTGFHGQFVANTASIHCSEVILLEFSGDGEMKQSRYVMSVEASGILVVTLKAWKGEEVGSVIFNAANRGRSFETLNLGSCSIEVLVAWSLICPYCPQLAPDEFLFLSSTCE